MKKFSWFIALLVLAGCDSSWTLDFSNVNSANAPQLNSAVTYTDWTEVKVGVDFKQTLVPVGTHTELIDVVRIDPSAAELTVYVDEAQPQTVSAWQEQLNAVAVINGSYFDEDYQLVTRTKTSAGNFGPLLSGTTGWLAETDARWNITDTMSETGDQWIQSYPLLVEDHIAVFNEGTSDTAQRTAVATDSSGHLYWIIAEYGVLTLAEFSDVLASFTEPELDRALNLDGGSSTGLAIHSDTVNYLDDSFVVPSVVVLY